MELKPRGTGLSPSSMSSFLSCQRLYYHKKVANTPIDTDLSEDITALQIGKAFHKCLEDCRHDLKGYGLTQTLKVATEHSLSEDEGLLIFAMLARYQEMHVKTSLEVVDCEFVINTPIFYGIVDVILKDKDDSWFLADMKTAASYRPDLVPTLPLHPQLNLYAAHVMEIATSLNLDPTKYKGCRYRLTTKSKIGRKDGENSFSYIDRLKKAVKSFDFVIPKDIMNPAAVSKIHLEIAKTIEARGPVCSPDLYPQNLSSCMNYFRPCSFFSQCHGSLFTNLVDSLEVITSG